MLPSRRCATWLQSPRGLTALGAESPEWPMFDRAETADGVADRIDGLSHTWNRLIQAEMKGTNSWQSRVFHSFRRPLVYHSAALNRGIRVDDRSNGIGHLRERTKL
jgi:hypothetical protein